MSKVHIRYFQYFFKTFVRSFVSCLFVFYTTITRSRGHRIVVDKKSSIFLALGTVMPVPNKSPDFEQLLPFLAIFEQIIG